MVKKHEKSTCCQAIIIKFGQKRRQCTDCKRTWSVWPKRRGRKKKRVGKKLVTAFLQHEIASLAYVAKRKGVSEATIQFDIKRSRDLFIQKTAWSAVPAGPLILIADAVVELVEHKWRVVHLMLVRSIQGTHAVILPPLIITGHESVSNWHKAFMSIDGQILSRIKAVVSDGHKGILLGAHDHGWIIQRCHFHLLARIQAQRSRFASARNKQEAHLIFEHVHTVLRSLNDQAVQDSLNILEEISWLSKSKEVRNILSGLISNCGDFRSYITHPELNLPTTNNTAESLASLIAGVKNRLRGFPTVNSFTKWVVSLLLFKARIKCTGDQQN